MAGLKLAMPASSTLCLCSAFNCAGWSGEEEYPESWLLLMTPDSSSVCGKLNPLVLGHRNDTQRQLSVFLALGCGGGYVPVFLCSWITVAGNRMQIRRRKTGGMVVEWGSQAVAYEP